MTPKVAKQLHAGVITPAEIMLFILPTLNFRIVRTNNEGTTFRVEQVVDKGQRWKPLSTHTDPRPYVALMFAVAAAEDNQLTLTQKSG